MRKILEVVACVFLLAGIVGCDDCPTCRQNDYTTTQVATDGSIITTTHHCSNGHCYSTSVTTTPAQVPIKYQTPAPPPVVVTVIDPSIVTAEDAAGTPPPPIAAVTGGTKRAVISGVNVYKDPSAPQLAGCCNDARNIKAKAIASWNFKEENIVLLLDGDATVAAVKKALTDAVSASKPGDSLLFWNSSHGATDTDPQTGELYDFVCMTDFSWDRAHELANMDFKAIFGALPNGVIVGFASDSCFSAILDKNISKHKHPVKPKSPTPPEEVRIRVAKAHARGGKAKAIIDGILDVAFISGCRIDQTSADSQDDAGNPAGAFTAMFLKDFDALANASVTDLTAKIDADLAAESYDQQPTCSGAQVGKPWLGGK